MTLIEFILARLDEEEALAHEAMGKTPSFEGGDADWCPDWLYSGIRHLVRNCDIECSKHDVEPGGDCGWPHRYAGAHIAHWDPKHVLADVEARRSIVRQCETTGYWLGRHGILVALASPYVDHPSYAGVVLP